MNNKPIKKKLTNAIVKGLEVTGKKYRVWDTEQPSLYLLVSAAGSKTYYVSYARPTDKSRQDYKLGGDKAFTPAEARKEARSKLGDVARGIDIQQRRKDERKTREEQRHNTLGAFIERKYEPWAKQHRKGWEADSKRVKKQFGSWFKLPLVGITVSKVSAWRTKQLEKGLTAACINRDINRLRGILTRAVEMDVLEDTPLRKLKKLPEEKAVRVRYLSEDEEKRLREVLIERETELRQRRDRFNQWLIERHQEPLETLNGEFADHVRPMVLLALNTGMRISEVRKLRWQDVDWNGNVVTVIADNSKVGKTRHIPLTSEAYNVLAAWKEQGVGKGLMFPSPKTGGLLDNISSAWRAVRQAAGLYNPDEKDLHFRFHDLRHSFASNLVMAGVDLNQTRELMGPHGSIDMTLRYAHLTPQSQQSAISVLDGHMAKRCAGES